jgi:ABC-type lipoprotein release transport system permease subunit
METFVFGIEPTDPLTYLVVCAGLLVTAALAAWVPARRAAAVDPARVLSRDA